ncbi:DNA polymerase (family 10) [Allocatelliglobosispora scoriae]|uniref:DNA polymerase beta n=1 Tax=Allocatelliglobosispora scoriae TaxID=643052 RepID=A0A841BHA8_9ACTN|nr:DNA polymerase/3'-5' exonuclease PolX [Allocatelliglobosispora scoriae]MBB5867674.1 DNA polymerase (family 10) [Allocatelliglobosispora scoriae]
MARANDTVARLFQEYADLIWINGGDAFKARAYEKAARSIAGHHDDVAVLDLAGLQQIPNVGKSTAVKIAEFLRTGSVVEIEELRELIPAGVRELTAIPHLGPKKAITLHRELGVSSVAELVTAIEEGRLISIKGFGPKSGEQIMHGIELLATGAGRVMVSTAMGVAERMVGALSAIPGTLACMYAGSLRRMRETIGDVDILAAAEDSTGLMDAFVGLPGVAEVIVRGPKKTSVRMADANLQVDLRVVPPGAWGAALVYFTGSQAHNIRLREMAIRQSLKLSEYGLFQAEDGSLVASETEEQVYEQLGLPWIPPPLREDRGEVDAALAEGLPTLLTVADIQGDLHTHTDLTDGVASMATMVAAAQKRGLRYYAVTDHAPDLTMQRMTTEKMLAQRVELRELAATTSMALLHGTELNIGPEGGVDWDAEFLAGFDVCVASVHSHFRQDRDAMTRRFIRACENPYVAIIGHPSTRSIGRREPVDADWDAVFAAAARTGTALEINCFPDRLDLPDELVFRARRHGVKFAVNTDSHATGHLANLRYGVGIAQRGWLSSEDVINAWPLERLQAFIAAQRAGS